MAVGSLCPLPSEQGSAPLKAGSCPLPWPPTSAPFVTLGDPAIAGPRLIRRTPQAAARPSEPERAGNPNGPPLHKWRPGVACRFG